VALLLGGVLLALVGLVTAQLRRRHDATDLGRMSEKWLEHELTSGLH